MPAKRCLQTADNQTNDSSGSEYELEAIVAQRVHKGDIQYRARWSGYGSSEDTWEPLGNIVDTQAFADYEQRTRGRRKTPHVRSPRQRATTSSDSNDSPGVAPTRAKKYKRLVNAKKPNARADSTIGNGKQATGLSTSATVAANVENNTHVVQRRQVPTNKKKTEKKQQLQLQHSDENNAPVASSSSSQGQGANLRQMVVVGTNTVIRWATKRPTAAMLAEHSETNANKD